MVPPYPARIRPALLLSTLFLAFVPIRADDTRCHVAAAHDPTPAENALTSGKLDDAEKLYREAVSKSPHSPEDDAGLIRTLLIEQKIDDAASAAQSALAAKPDSVALLTALAEVQFRQGKIAESAGTADQAFRSDRCYARLYLLRGRILHLNSMDASANRAINAAHVLDPYDPNIRGAWVQTLPLAQRIEQQKQYIAANPSADGEERKRAQAYLSYLESESNDKSKGCRMVSSITSTQIPLTPLAWQSGLQLRRGLRVLLNNKEADLEVDSGASGLVVSRSVAERSGLKAADHIQLGGVGDEGAQAGYTAQVDSIRIGSLEFRDCRVEVGDRQDIVGGDGLIGTDVFRSFLVTLDFPMGKFILAPLPPRPGDAPGATATLSTSAKGQGTGAAAESSDSSGPQDRYLPPEFKDYTQLFRSGHFLILPVMLNHKVPRLFIVDTGAATSSISPDAAAAVTKVHGNSPVGIIGLNGKVAKVSTGDHIVLNFGGIEQTNNDLFSFDTANISRAAGVEISGFLGDTVLRELTISIDYRDALIKFDYDLRHGNHDFSH
jgi:predicted aspartyl protease